MGPPGPGNNRSTLIVASSDGNYVTDIDGNELLDGIAGLWNVNIGHNRSAVKEAVASQMDELAYYQLFDGIAHPRAFDLAERLTSMFSQENMSRVMYGSGGSDAVETALKMSRQYWIAAGEHKRTKFLSLRNAYHGVHFGGTSVSGGNVYRLNHGPLLSDCILLDAPWLYRNPWNCDDPEKLVELCINQMIDQIQFNGADTIAAFIAEPVQGAGGVIVPPPSYWPRLREVCDQYGILLIADEVVTGFGRTGSMLGSRGWGVSPDILCLAKGLSAGYIPLGATMFNQRVTDTIEHSQNFSGVIMHGYTYSGHPVACAAALAVLDIVEQEDLPGNAADVGGYLLEQLKPLVGSFDTIGEIRGKGMMMALDLVIDKKTREPVDPNGGYAERISVNARKEGVLVRPVGSKIILSPPLTLNRTEADHIVRALQTAFSLHS